MMNEETTQTTPEDLMVQVTDYYHRCLIQEPKVLDFLDHLKISMDAVEAFKLGYCNGTLTKKIPSRKKKSGQALRKGFADLGILNPQTGVEAFNGNVTLPVKGSDGTNRNLVGKKIRAPIHQDGSFTRLQESGIWNPMTSAYDEWILCDSMLDALIFWSGGLRHVSYIVNPTECPVDLIDSFVNRNVEKIYLAFANDDGGDDDARVFAEALHTVSIKPFRMRFPGVRHLSEIARKTEFMDEVFKGLVFEAQPFIVEGIVKKNPSSLFDLADHITTQLRDSDMQVESKGDDIMIKRHDRLYRIRILSGHATPGVLKINLLIIKGKRFFQNSLDLCLDRHRERYAMRVAERLNIDKELIQFDLGKILLHLEAHQQDQLALLTKAQEQPYQMTDEEKREAMRLLENPNLIEEVLQDFEQCGIRGESTNKLIAYLGAVSRKLLYPNPLSVIIQSSSSAGKTTLMDAILDMMPNEEVQKFSALTGQALFYMANQKLKHKILAVAEEEGLERASYPLKLLQSDGELKIATTGKDGKGHFETQEIEIHGPVSIFFSTTNLELDEELSNRALTLTVDESRDQTLAIHQQQRKAQTLEGLLARKQSDQIRLKHHNAQRLLQAIHVVNPYGESLSFRSDRLTMRRDHMKYLALIATITLLHQYQRPLKQCGDLNYIESTVEDIELANRLANEVLGRRLEDILPQTQKLLHLIYDMVQKRIDDEGRPQDKIRFTRKDVLNYTKSQFGWTQLKTHLRRLEDHDFIIPHRRERGRPFVYECLYQGEGKDRKPFLMGLVPTELLRTPETQGRVAMGGRGSG